LTEENCFISPERCDRVELLCFSGELRQSKFNFERAATDKLLCFSGDLRQSKFNFERAATDKLLCFSGELRKSKNNFVSPEGFDRVKLLCFS
jgi:hypothetical protein